MTPRVPASLVGVCHGIGLPATIVTPRVPHAALPLESPVTKPHPLTITVRVVDAPRSDAWRQLWRRLLSPMPATADDVATTPESPEPHSVPERTAGGALLHAQEEAPHGHE
jgi:hypothetical protein